MEAGEELCHAYVDIAAPTHARRYKLHSIYNFVCNCPRCAGAEEGSSTEATCRDGGGAQSVQTQVEEQEEARIASCIQALQAAESGVEMERACEALEALHDAVVRGRSGGGRSDEAVVRVRSALLQGALETANAPLAIRTCSLLVRSYRGLYPANHPLLGLQLYTQGNLLTDHPEHATCVPEGALECLYEAQRVLRITHGSASKMVKGLEHLIAANSNRALNNSSPQSREQPIAAKY